MQPRELRDVLVTEARRLGFARIGFAPAGPARDRGRLEEWLANGRHGEMAWMARGVERRTDPRRFVPGARTIIALLTPYGNDEPARHAIGRVARYARGADYHGVIRRRLRKLARVIAKNVPGSKTSTAVDERPVLEKEWAERAGLGWIGKHTNLITEDEGSWFFISELITDARIAADEVSAKERCGRCTTCIDECPTGAITGPWTLDARRCISYLTIELKGPIPRELRALVGDWIFGCDVCQEVCPWNRFAVAVTEPKFKTNEGRFHGNPAEFLAMSEAQFAERFRGSAVMRAGRNGFLRNVCVALGTRGEPASIAPLERALADDAPLVRGHAAWALGRIGGTANALHARIRLEPDPYVLEEIAAALAAPIPTSSPPTARS